MTTGHDWRKGEGDSCREKWGKTIYKFVLSREKRTFSEFDRYEEYITERPSVEGSDVWHPHWDVPPNTRMFIKKRKKGKFVITKQDGKMKGKS